MRVWSEERQRDRGQRAIETGEKNDMTMAWKTKTWNGLKGSGQRLGGYSASLPHTPGRGSAKFDQSHRKNALSGQKLVHRISPDHTQNRAMNEFVATHRRRIVGNRARRMHYNLGVEVDKFGMVGADGRIKYLPTRT